MRAVRAKRIKRLLTKAGAWNVKSEKRRLVKVAWKRLTRNTSKLVEADACGRREGRRKSGWKPDVFGCRSLSALGKRLNGKSRKPISRAYVTAYDATMSFSYLAPYGDNNYI